MWNNRFRFGFRINTSATIGYEEQDPIAFGLCSHIAERVLGYAISTSLGLADIMQ